MGINVAIAGAGHWHTERHVAALQSYGVHFVGVFDPDAGAAERISRLTGSPVSEHLPALLARDDLDFVLALPIHAEGPATLTALLDAAIPAIVEKPVARRGEDLEPLARRAAATNEFYAVPFVHRYDTIWSHPAIESGVPLHAHFRIVNGPIERYIDAGCAWMTDLERAGGGALRNLGIHAADALLRWMPTGTIEVLGTVLVPDSVHGVEIFAVANLLVDGRVPVTIEVGYTFPNPDSGMTRQGDAEWRLATSTSYLVERGGSLAINRQHGVEETTASLPEADKYERFVCDVMDSWCDGKPSPVPLDDCVQAGRLVDQLYDQARVAALPMGGRPA